MEGSQRGVYGSKIFTNYWPLSMAPWISTIIIFTMYLIFISVIITINNTVIITIILIISIVIISTTINFCYFFFLIFIN